MKNTFLLLCILGLFGCAQKGGLYSWGNYEAQTYNYFKDYVTYEDVVRIFSREEIL